MSIWYVDTSAALKLVLEEPESEALAHQIDSEQPVAIRIGVDSLVTYDTRMTEAAHDLGLHVVAPA